MSSPRTCEVRNLTFGFLAAGSTDSSALVLNVMQEKCVRSHVDLLEQGSHLLMVGAGMRAAPMLNPRRVRIGRFFQERSGKGVESFFDEMAENLINHSDLDHYYLE